MFMLIRALLLSTGLACLAGCSATPLGGQPSSTVAAEQADRRAPASDSTVNAPTRAEAAPDSLALRLAFDAANGLVWGHSFGIDYHRALGQHLGLEANLQAVTLDDFYWSLFGEDEVDVQFVELDLGARYTLHGVKLGHRQLRPFGALGLALVDVEGATPPPGVLDPPVADGTDLGLYARVGVQLQAEEGFLVGLDLKTVLGTEDVNTVSVGLSAGWSF